MNYTDLDKMYEVYKDLCESTFWKDQKLVELGQEKQNNFYGKWIAEMVRIAKVGLEERRIIGALGMAVDFMCMVYSHAFRFVYWFLSQGPLSYLNK